MKQLSDLQKMELSYDLPLTRNSTVSFCKKMQKIIKKDIKHFEKKF